MLEGDAGGGESGEGRRARRKHVDGGASGDIEIAQTVKGQGRGAGEGDAGRAAGQEDGEDAGGGFLEDAVVGEVREEGVAVGVLDGGAGGEGEAAAGGYRGIGGGLEDELRGETYAGEIHGVDDGAGAIGDGESAETQTDLGWGEGYRDGALRGAVEGRADAGRAEDGVGIGDEGEVLARDAFGDNGDGLDGHSVSRSGEGYLFGDGLLEIPVSETDGGADGEALGEGGGGEGGQECEEEPGTYCREREGLIARVSVAQRDSHHSSN